MNKKSMMISLMVVFALAICVNAHAEEVTAWQGAWNSTGGFFYNALPWNWGNWMGQ